MCDGGLLLLVASEFRRRAARGKRASRRILVGTHRRPVANQKVGVAVVAAAGHGQERSREPKPFVRHEPPFLFLDDRPCN